MWFLREIHAARWGLRSRSAGALLVATIVVMLFLAALLEAAVWAAMYVHLEAISSFEEALYFSIVTLTTLGYYGDITLNEDWRLLCSMEAANGIILFGWSTALVFAFVQRIAAAMKSAEESPS
jgi:voltage-gated potassium channel Kch